MANNKRHNIIDDAWHMDARGGAEHTFRVGMTINTVINAMPIVLDDLVRICDAPKYDPKLLGKDLPVLLNFSSSDLKVAILIVHDKDSNHIQCFPFSDVEGFWWLYEVAFDLVPGGLIEIRPIHPMVEEFSPTKGMIDHLEVLAAIAHGFLGNLQAGNIEIYECIEDVSKINIKRKKARKEPIINDWRVKYVEQV